VFHERDTFVWLEVAFSFLDEDAVSPALPAKVRLPNPLMDARRGVRRSSRKAPRQPLCRWVWNGPLGTGLEAMQLSPHHTDLAGL